MLVCVDIYHSMIMCTFCRSFSDHYDVSTVVFVMLGGSDEDG